VVLAGDAAHRLTPAGALGLNTGIQGAHNLAWKLAAVLHCWAGPDLLDTYEAQWRPAARRSVELSHRIETTGHRAASQMPGQMLGAAYQEGAFVPDGTGQGSAKSGRRRSHRAACRTARASLPEEEAHLLREANLVAREESEDDRLGRVE
jgi:2-polyprenyl-6-methoxyphenol hydroxylase-like FAD-dependent oxidoreductase